MAARRFLVPIDLTKNEIQNAVAQVLGTDPGAPVAGQFYYNSTSQRWMYRDATAFVSDTARARHTGTQLAATISDFDTQVRLSRLDQMAVPTASVSMNSQKLINLLTGTAATDAVNVQQLQDSIAGLSWKDEVRVATTAAGTLTTSFANASVIDGVTLATNDRILIKDQAAGAENGIYFVNATGSPTRTTDADTGAEVSGAAVFVVSGTTNAGTRWVCNTSGTITLNTTALTFANFGGGSSYTAGNGLTLSGNDFNVGAGVGIISNVNDVAVDTAVVARKFTTLLAGVGPSYVVNHALANQWVSVQIVEVATLATVECDVVRTDANNVTVIFAVAQTTNAFRAIVIG